jgi:hypothetical protein
LPDYCTPEVAPTGDDSEASAEDSLKHTHQLFVVEVRRHRGGPTTVEAKTNFEETFRGAPRDAVHEADQADVEANQAEKRALEIDPTIPSGRILPSLIESSPWTLPPATAEPSRRRARSASSDDKQTRLTKAIAANAPKRRREPPPSSNVGAGSVIASHAAPDESPRARSNDSPHVVSESILPINPGQIDAKSTTTKKPRRRDGLLKAHMSPRVTRGPIDVEPLPNPDARPTSPTVSEDHSPRKRRLSVMARYVFGTELKPGERWKQRLRRAR